MDEAAAATIPNSEIEEPDVYIDDPIRLHWFGTRNVHYRLRWSTDLTNWNVYQGELVGDNAEIVLNVSDVVGGPAPSKFFSRLYAFWDTGLDSNSDGISDYMALLLGLNSNFTDGDSDGDGIPDTEEDSDGDGIDNLTEIEAGSNPADSDDFPTHFVVVWKSAAHSWDDRSYLDPQEPSVNSIRIRKSWIGSESTNGEWFPF